MKKGDLGALRLSDIEENMIVATTDIPGMSKTAVESPDLVMRENPRRKPKKHYSKASSGQWVFGTREVYTDLKVTNENYVLETL